MGPRPSKFSSANAGEDAPATDLLAGIVATDSREQSGIWSTASGVLAAYRTEGALASTRAAPLDLDAFCDGPEHPLHLLDRSAAAPIRSARRGHPRRRARCRLRPVPRRAATGHPTLLALDEVANIAPIPDLPAMVSEGAGQGLLVLACLQDLSQARSRWGSAADGFLSLFGTTVVLRGIADTTTLRDLSALAGDHEVRRRRRSAARWTAGAASVLRRRSGPSRQPGLPVDAVAHGSARTRPRPGPGQGGRRGRAHAGPRALALARAPARRHASSPAPVDRRPAAADR